MSRLVERRPKLREYASDQLPSIRAGGDRLRCDSRAQRSNDDIFAVVRLVGERQEQTRATEHRVRNCFFVDVGDKAEAVVTQER